MVCHTFYLRDSYYWGIYLSFSIEKGEIVGYIGPNGAGKTTLIRCLTGLYRYVGTVYFNGVSTKCNEDFSEQVGYLPQKFGAYQELTVEENLQYFCELKNISKEK